MFVFGVFLVRIFLHMNWIQRDPEYLHIQPKCGKIQTRKTPNKDTFYAVSFVNLFSCQFPVKATSNWQIQKWWNYCLTKPIIVWKIIFSFKIFYGIWTIFNLYVIHQFLWDLFETFQQYCGISNDWPHYFSQIWMNFIFCLTCYFNLYRAILSTISHYGIPLYP